MLAPNKLDLSLDFAARTHALGARYSLSIIATLTAALVTYLALPWISPAVSLLFFVAVLFSSFQGLKPGLLSAFASAIFCYFLSTPHLWVLGIDDILRLTVFMLTSIFVGALTMSRQHATETAQRIERQLAITVKSIGDAVITTDPRGRITQMNLVAQSLTGWRVDQARGRDVSDIVRLIEGDTFVQDDNVVHRVIQDNAVIAFGSDTVMISRDGSRISIEQIATPVRNSEGTIAGVVLVLRNVPDNRLAQSEQEILSDRIALLASIDLSMVALDMHGRCIYASNSASAIFGYRSEDIVGREFHELVHFQAGAPGSICNPEECELLNASSDQASETSITDVVLRSDRTSARVNVTTSRILIGGKALGTILTLTDLTDRDKSREALMTLRTIVDGIDDAIITHTIDGEIIGWNKSAERLYGYCEEDVLGRSISIVHPPGLRNELTELFQRVARRETAPTFETVRIGRQGERKRVLIKVRPIENSENEITAITQIVREIVEQPESTDIQPRRLNQSSSSREAAARKAAARRDGVAYEESFEHSTVALPPTSSPTPFRGVTMVGQSHAMEKLIATSDRIASNDSSVLITGATGTGKELVARSIHQKSQRASGPFIDINCSAIPETLIEAELFGHQKGTFTGAHEHRPGLFEMASGGTLFLDEVDALPLAAQAKLLRVVQERKIRRIGGRTNIAVDVRIISATNCDLSLAINEGRFRADLFYRLRVVPLHVPALCQREGDVDLLIDHFLNRHAESSGVPVRRFTPEAREILRDYPWPGNVRELENTIEYALALSTRPELHVDDLPTDLVEEARAATPGELKKVLEAYINDSVPLAEIEKRYILSVLQQFGGNQVKAAAALGIDRSKLYRRLRQYGVKAVKFLQEEELDGLQLRGSKSNGA